MKIPRYWAKERYEGMDPEGRRRTFVAAGWSFSSVEEARREALARARHVFDVITRDRHPREYDYSDRPIREEILEQIDDHGEEIALITRNRYGALVLNSAGVLFADVDLPEVRPSGILESILLVLSPRRWRARREALTESTRQQIEQWALNNPRQSFRLYRTREGFRLLFTDRMYDPSSEETARILQSLNADPMYVKLTQKQKCFRARLTSKPWRCGCPRPPHAYPWDSPEAESEVRAWERLYDEHDSGFRTCELIQEFGPKAEVAAVERAVEKIVSIHDTRSGVESLAPLA